ncbi:unnamed protein product, partial [Rotaria sp. Silwood1]
MNQHQIKGLKLWEIARDYSRARKGEWGNIVHLRETDLKSLLDKNLEESQRCYAMLAYEEYRAAAIDLGNGGTEAECSELRRLMAIALYTGEQILQAQIYTIAAMHLLVQKTGSAEAKKLNSLQKLLEKFRGSNTPKGTSTPASSASPAASQVKPSTSHELVSVNLEVLPVIQLRAHIRNELREVVVQHCLVTSQEKEVKTSEELILTAKRKASQHKTAGAALQVTGVLTGVGMAGASLSNTVTTILVGSSFGP